MFLFHQYSLSDVSLRQVRSELVQMIKCDRDYWNWKICKMWGHESWRVWDWKIDTFVKTIRPNTQPSDISDREEWKYQISSTTITRLFITKFKPENEDNLKRRRHQKSLIFLRKNLWGSSFCWVRGCSGYSNYSRIWSGSLNIVSHGREGREGREETVTLSHERLTFASKAEKTQHNIVENLFVTGSF